MADREIAELEAKLGKIKTALQKKAVREQERINVSNKQSKTRVKLIVGGVRHETSAAVIAEYPQSFLESLVSGRHEVYRDDVDGSIFIDRDGEMFRHILNAMRVGRLVLPLDFNEFDLLAEELGYYGLPFVVERASKLGCDFTRREVASLLSLQANRVLSLQGMRFCGIDLSGLRFGLNGTVQFAGANFSGTDLDTVHFTNLDLTGCIFNGASCDKTNFSGCNLTRAMFVRVKLMSALFPGANCSRATFIDSDFSQANFSSAQLTDCEFTSIECKDTNFQNANFAASKFEKMDMGKADVTGATNLPVLPLVAASTDP